MMETCACCGAKETYYEMDLDSLTDLWLGLSQFATQYCEKGGMYKQIESSRDACELVIKLTFGQQELDAIRNAYASVV